MAYENQYKAKLTLCSRWHSTQRSRPRSDPLGVNRRGNSQPWRLAGHPELCTCAPSNVGERQIMSCAPVPTRPRPDAVHVAYAQGESLTGGVPCV